MYNVVKSVIEGRNYKLSDIQQKIKKLYIIGDLTEDQMNELFLMASNGVSTDAERPETLAMIKSLSDRLDAVEKALAALQGGSEDNLSEYPVWIPWDGITNDYQYGAIVQHNGTLWRSEYGGQNVWEPGAPGTEAMWVLYEETDLPL